MKNRSENFVYNQPGIFKRGRLGPANGPEPNPDGQTLGNVVHRDGDDEQKDPAPMVVFETALRSVRQVSNRDSLLRRVATGLSVTASQKGATLNAPGAKVLRTFLRDG